MPIDANADLTVGNNIRLLRRSKAWNQEELAHRAGIKVITLRDIETGKTQDPRPGTLQKIAKALSVPPERLASLHCVFVDVNHNLFAPVAAQSDSLPENDQTVWLAAHITRTDLMMDRRTAMKATAAVLAGTSLLDPLEGWLWVFDESVSSRPQPLAAEKHHDAEKLEQAAKIFRDLDHGSGGGLYRKAVVALLNEVALLLDDGGLSKAVKERLYRVMADLAETAAMMSWDCGLQRQAQDYYGLALRSAYAGGDFAFGANVLAAMARQMICLGHPQDALELVRLAQQRASGAGDPRVLAMLRTREAWALAALGRVAAFQRATMQAREHFAIAPASGEPHWISYFNDAELAGVTGGRLLELARHSPKEYAEDASAEITHALRSRGAEAGRSFALDQIGLAESRFLLGDTEAAVEQTHQALSAVEHTQSGRAHLLLGDLFRQTTRYPRVRSVQEVQNRIHAVLANGENAPA